MDDKNLEFTMMFGNSYKDWKTQFKEFLRIEKPIKIVSVETSKEKWIGWGGLKWCEECDFQEELNREGCQEKEPDNPRPRKYDNMTFQENRICFNEANKIFSNSK